MLAGFIHINETAGKGPAAFVGFISSFDKQDSQFRSVANSVQTALACLAYEGEENDGDAEKAFLAGSAVFNCSVPFPKTRDYSLESFTLALNDLAQATPLLKKTILEACWRCVLYDGSVNERESALLSAVAAALGAPAPVWKEWSN